MTNPVPILLILTTYERKWILSREKTVDAPNPVFGKTGLTSPCRLLDHRKPHIPPFPRLLSNDSAPRGPVKVIQRYRLTTRPRRRQRVRLPSGGFVPHISTMQTDFSLRLPSTVARQRPSSCNPSTPLQAFLSESKIKLLLLRRRRQYGSDVGGREGRQELIRCQPFKLSQRARRPPPHSGRYGGSGDPRTVDYLLPAQARPTELIDPENREAAEESAQGRRTVCSGPKLAKQRDLRASRCLG